MIDCRATRKNVHQEGRKAVKVFLLVVIKHASGVGVLRPRSGCPAAPQYCGGVPRGSPRR